MERLLSGLAWVAMAMFWRLPPPWFIVPVLVRFVLFSVAACCRIAMPWERGQSG